MSDPYLAHHGVKGMHWGVRKEKDTTYAATPKRGSAPDPDRYKNWEKAGKHSIGKTLRDVGLIGLSSVGGMVMLGNAAPIGGSNVARGALGAVGGALGAVGGAKMARSMHQTEKTLGKVQDNRRSLGAGRGVVWKTDKTPEEVGQLGQAKLSDYMKGGAKNVLLGPMGIAAGVADVSNRELQRGLETQTHIASGKVKVPK